MKDEKHVFTRRDFIKSTVGAAAVVGLAGQVSGQVPSPGRTSHVVLVRNKTVLNGDNKVNLDILRIMLDDTVSRVTGIENGKAAWKSLFKHEDTKGLVPTPHLNPTHKELVDLVKEALVEAGVDKDKILMAQQRNPVNVKRCTALICMPGLKAHWLTGIGTVLKNYILFSGKPRDYHTADSAKLGEIWNLDFVKGKTRLILVDALTPLCDKGPQADPKYKWPYKGLISGTDPVAVDTVCLKIITTKRDLIKGEPWPLSPPPICVEAADKKYGLGTSKWDEIVIEKSGWTKDILV
jgi:hypothetical protein